MDGGSPHRLGRCLVFRMAEQRATDRKAIPPRPKQRRALSSARSSTYGKQKPSPSLRGHRHRGRTFKDATLCRLRDHRSNPALPHMKRAGKKESILFHAGKRASSSPIGLLLFSASRSIHAVRQPSLGPSSPETAKSGLSQSQGRAAFRSIRPGPLFSGKAGPIFPAAWQSASGPHSLQRRPPLGRFRRRRGQVPEREDTLSDGGPGMSGKTPLSAIRAWRSAGEDRWRMCPCLCAWSRTRRCRHVARPCRGYRIPKDRTLRLCWPHRKTTFPRR